MLDMLRASVGIEFLFVEPFRTCETARILKLLVLCRLVVRRSRACSTEQE
jgi:hypothetical protein